VIFDRPALNITLLQIPELGRNWPPSAWRRTSSGIVTKSGSALERPLDVALVRMQRQRPHG